LVPDPLKLAFIAGVIVVISLSLLPAKQAPPSLFNDKLEHLASHALPGLIGATHFGHGAQRSC
jgi:hypothetical protein